MSLPDTFVAPDEDEEDKHCYICGEDDSDSCACCVECEQTECRCCDICGHDSHDCDCCHSCNSKYCSCCEQCEQPPGYCECCGECGLQECECCSDCETSPCQCDCCPDCGEKADDCGCGPCDECKAGDCHCHPMIWCRKCDTCACPECEAKGKACSHEDDKVRLYSGKSHGRSLVPPWFERGLHIAAPFERGYGADMWEIPYGEVDLVNVASDFYILESLRYDIPNRIQSLNTSKYISGSQKFFTEQHKEIVAEAERAFWHLVEKHIDTFANYAIMACSGEIRYHRCMATKIISVDRDMAWGGFYKMFKVLGPDSMLDIAKLFREFGGGSYGGELWATACETVHMYLVGKMPPNVFMDRMFSIEHNGGSLFSKLNWRCSNPPGWKIEHLKAKVLPAHGNSDWRTLLICVSPEIKELWDRYWDVTCKINGFTIPNPSASLKLKTCRNCGYDKEYGHSWHCDNPDPLNDKAYHNSYDAHSKPWLLPLKSDGTISDTEVHFMVNFKDKKGFGYVKCFDLIAPFKDVVLISFDQFNLPDDWEYLQYEFIDPNDSSEIHQFYARNWGIKPEHHWNMARAMSYGKEFNQGKLWEVLRQLGKVNTDA